MYVLEPAPAKSPRRRLRGAALAIAITALALVGMAVAGVPVFG